MYDSTLCIGCKACEGACAERWGLPYNDKVAAEEKISAHKLTAIETHGDKFARRLCMNCLQPACASVCPVGAIQKTTLGPVTYDASKCMGCRYCMQACPFQVPSYEWSSRLPRMRKCNMCYERQAAGKQTACAEVCPVGATINGDRDELIQEAKRRVDSLPAECLVGMPLIFEELVDDSERAVREDGKPLQWHRLYSDSPSIPDEPLPLSEELPNLGAGDWKPLTRAETPDDGWEEPLKLI